MRATGIVRRVDELGRVVLPMELRKVMDINEKDPMEIFVKDGQIILKKYEPACIFCGSAEEVIHYKGKNVYHTCSLEMRKQLKLEEAMTKRSR